MSELAALLRRTVEQLETSHAPDEALAVERLSRWRGRRLVPIGRAWRLGVLLIDRDARLYATGQVTRAIEPLRGVANKSPDAEVRREHRRAAARGRFPEGETVNFDYRAIDLEAPDEPLVIEAGTVMVRWNGTATRTLEGYLAERVDLLAGI
jgi:hypothetical protein